MDGVYGTLFSQRRGFYGLPRVDLGAKRTAVPPQPQPVSLGPASVLGSLMSYIGKQSTMTGEEVDALRAFDFTYCYRITSPPEAYVSRTQSRAEIAQHRRNRRAEP